MPEQQLTAFTTLIESEGSRLYRDLPWRRIDDAFLVLTSEVMLQQTQVVRVLKHWERWTGAFPTIDALAAASTSDVLELWQGMGYHRRALALKRAAEQCSEHNAGQLPTSYAQLLALPGVGPATAAGVCVFAYGDPQVYLETNVRTVFLHHFFEGRDKVPDSEIIPLVEATCNRSDPQSWYYALLDYGNHLKSILPNPSRRSKHHARQSIFEGSVRQKRAFLLREILAQQGSSTDDLLELLNSAERQAARDGLVLEELEGILGALTAEGFLSTPDNAHWFIAD
jgi:A/G-specific adenine glycosylase